ncbi:protein ripply3 isoform X2 [Physeter macrocephalus]|uniref:Protein ripply3 n=1 Tax=Physeter macrocephalus TaxID=9755 RepID=A0A455BKI1_PHYMC|nr:protein ripply3 isoform X2 [Physeter catodon]XP_028349262.1 protein ripply3 isoform X2 [Physeter catodon]|eukprot:XP_028349261.1 protein ripply3 isoform X1 [Physeter catodon]
MLAPPELEARFKMHEPGDCVQLIFPPWDPSQCPGYRDNSKRKRSLSNTLKLEPGCNQQTFGSKGAFGFQHPVRLYLPISKRQEYLQSSGEKVLASFPVQATIHFYNDESNSDEEQDQEVQPSDLQCQEVQDGPGGKGRDQLTNPGWHPGGCGGLGGKGPLPYPDSLEDAGCSSFK